MRSIPYICSVVLILVTLLATHAVFSEQPLTLPLDDKADMYYDQGIDFLFKDSLRAAEQFLKKSLVYQPHYAPAHFALAQVYEQEEDLDNALVELQRTIELDRESYLTLYHLARILTILGKDAQAIQTLQKSVSLNPYYQEAYEQLASLYLQTGDYSAAERMYTIIEKLKDLEK